MQIEKSMLFQRSFNSIKFLFLLLKMIIYSLLFIYLFVIYLFVIYFWYIYIDINLINNYYIARYRLIMSCSNKYFKT